MGADGIDHRSLLADAQVPGTVQRKATLLLACLGRHEPHVRPGHRLADRLSVNRIVLMALHIGLHVGRRHQANSVTERLEFARPMVRRGAGLDTNQARRQLLEEGQHIPPLKLTTEDDIALRIDAVNLENRLRDVETDGRDRLHDLAPPNRGGLNSTHIHGTHVPSGGAVHSIKSDRLLRCREMSRWANSVYFAAQQSKSPSRASTDEFSPAIGGGYRA